MGLEDSSTQGLSAHDRMDDPVVPEPDVSGGDATQPHKKILPRREGDRANK